MIWSSWSWFKLLYGSDTCDIIVIDFFNWFGWKYREIVIVYPVLLPGKAYYLHINILLKEFWVFPSGLWKHHHCPIFLRTIKISTLLFGWSFFQYISDGVINKNVFTLLMKFRHNNEHKVFWSVLHSNIKWNLNILS